MNGHRQVPCLIIRIIAEADSMGSTCKCLRVLQRPLSSPICCCNETQIPLVEGDVWWKHIAKVEEWDDSIGDAAEVATIQDELWKVFQPSQRRQKEGITNGFHPAAAGAQNKSFESGPPYDGGRDRSFSTAICCADGQISPAPAPLVALAPPLIGPDTSAQPMVGSFTCLPPKTHMHQRLALLYSRSCRCCCPPTLITSPH